MAHTIGWLLPRHIIAVTFLDTVHSVDVENAAQQALAYMNQSLADRVFILADITQVKRIEYTAHTLAHLPGIVALSQHPRYGWTAYFDDKNPFHTIMLTYASKVRADRLRVLHDREAALAFLAQQGAPMPAHHHGS